jgi:hypothetical protein
MHPPVPEGQQIQLWMMGVTMKDRDEVLRKSVAAIGGTSQKLESHGYQLRGYSIKLKLLAYGLDEWPILFG